MMRRAFSTETRAMSHGLVFGTVQLDRHSMSAVGYFELLLMDRNVRCTEQSHTRQPLARVPALKYVCSLSCSGVTFQTGTRRRALVTRNHAEGSVMRHSLLHWISTALVALLFALGTAFAQQQSSDEEQVLQLESGYCTAQIKRDAGYLDKLLANDYAGVSSRGVRETKADVLASAKDRNNTTSSCVDKDVKVRIYGDAAVVTGRQIYSGIYNGEPFKNRQVLWTDTLVRRDGRWQVVASHATPVEK
jgi:hypothetical protein